MSEKIWKNRKDIIIEYYHTKNSLRNLNTSFKFINDNIFSPGIFTISARPSVGKSLLLDQIGHDFVKNGFRWLSFQLELTSYDIIKRELIYSNIPYDKVEDYFKSVIYDPIDVVEYVSINNLYDIAVAYINEHKNNDIIITIDHLFLVAGCDNGKNLQPIFTSLVKLKKLGAYIFALSHLKRDIYLADRCKQGHVNNQIFENDVYMSDTIIQYADFAIALDMPVRRGISIYGPGKIPVKNNDIIITTLKNRNGNRYSYHYHLNDNLTFEYIQRFDDSGMCTAINLQQNNNDEDSFDNELY